jgi:hypothetical protein
LSRDSSVLPFSRWPLGNGGAAASNVAGLRT